MTAREIIRRVLEGERPPWTPWSFKFTQEAAETLRAHYGTDDLDTAVGNHILTLGSDIGFFDAMGGDRFRDVFGVVWDRSVDRDIGIVEGCLLPEPTLAGFEWPDPCDERFFDDMAARIQRWPHRFRVFEIGFSLFERAWTLRGMENLLMDMALWPDFVHELLDVIADYVIAQAREAMERADIDAVYFGDDWGQQHGLIMGPPMWRTFLLPRLRRMYAAVREKGHYVMIHSCGDVDEVFPDLIDAGLHCFNPFQPEVMDVFALHAQYRGRLAFHGGLSTQRTLPYGTVDAVRAESERLLAMGRSGGYIFSPAHAVESDVPLENMLAFIRTAQGQPGVPEALRG